MLVNSPRTIVLGLDGLDARLTRVLMDQGWLPGMTALARNHGLRETLSTTPAESGVAWACFARGANPGHTNLFDFVERSEGSYAPRLAGVRYHTAPVGFSQAGHGALLTGLAAIGGIGAYAGATRLTRRQWLKWTAAGSGALLAGGAVGGAAWAWRPRRQELAESTVMGRAWWDRQARQGVRSVVLRVPMTFPAGAEPGARLMAGLGVPDIRGTQGVYTLLTDHAEVSGPRQIPIVWRHDAAVIRLPGPENPVRLGSTSDAQLHLRRLEPDRILVSTGHGEQRVERGTWSSWITLDFRFSPLAGQTGRARAYFAPGPGDVRLYLTPIEFDPQDVPTGVPIGSPAAWARQLAQTVGDYRTIGWETATQGLADGVLDEAAYLVDATTAIDGNEALLHTQLSRDDWDHLTLVVQATDQVSHMFWDDEVVAVQRGEKRADPEHPLVMVYRRADQIVQRVADEARTLKTRLVVLSDHGFAPFRQAVNLNTWLARRGWLALKDRDARDGASADKILASTPWANVDWFNTRAYAMGLAGIYLNVVGREPDGIVKPQGEYEFLQNRLIRDLLDWTDPATGRPVFANVYRRQDIYDGPYVDAAPDLIFGLHEGYRVSSATVVGGIPEGEMTPNASHWCGDHCGVDAGLIPGILLANFNTSWPARTPIAQLADHLWPGLEEQA